MPELPFEYRECVFHGFFANKCMSFHRSACWAASHQGRTCPRCSVNPPECRFRAGKCQCTKVGTSGIPWLPRKHEHMIPTPHSWSRWQMIDTWLSPCAGRGQQQPDPRPSLCPMQCSTRRPMRAGTCMSSRSSARCWLTRYVHPEYDILHPGVLTHARRGLKLSFLCASWPRAFTVTLIQIPRPSSCIGASP